jgi:hypothetical protein
MKKMNGRKGALLLGGGFLAAALFLWGCLNTVSIPDSDRRPAPEPDLTDGGDPAPGSFTVALLVEGGSGTQASRAVAGPDAKNIQLDKLRNIAQLVVVDKEGNIVNFAEARKQTAGESSVSLPVRIPAGQDYAFLLLMGHWPCALDGGETYQYADTLPTLLAAGFTSRLITTGPNKVTITMRSLVADTVFVPEGALGVKPVEARPDMSASFLIPGGWKLNWTIQKGWVDDAGVAQAGDDGLEVLLNARKAFDTLAAKPGFKSIGRSLNGAAAAESPDLTVTGNLVSLNLGDLAQDGTGSANFNLAYVPFGLTGAGWSAYEEQSAFKLESEGPVWILRNGVNDQARNGSTDYSSVGVGGKNGNGAVSYAVLDPAGDQDNDGITNRDEIKWGLDPAAPHDGDTDGDGFSDKMEAINGFDPLNTEDHPARGYPGSLAVTNGKPGTRLADKTTIAFISGGYVGTANGYYAVAAQGVAGPALAAYIPFDDLLAPNTHDRKITLPAPADWDQGWDVYVVIMKDRNVSVPALISLPPVPESETVIDW